MRRSCGFVITTPFVATAAGAAPPHDRDPSFAVSAAVATSLPGIASAGKAAVSSMPAIALTH